MGTVEIVLIVIGIAFFLASCFVQEKFSKKDIHELAKMSETEFQIAVEKQIGSAKVRVEELLEGVVAESLEFTKRGLEKETNKKIMAVSEYSDTILESMNKTHNEIMFLYSMLNDKHVELTQFANSLKQITSQKAMFSEEVMTEHSREASQKEVLTSTAYVSNEEKTMLYNTTIEENNDSIEHYSKNEKILTLHKRGKSDVEIAKELECGLGEVRLVLGLYKEGQA